MADVRAFRAFRYDLGRVGALRDVIAPPYDVIDPALQDALYARSPYNVIRLILNKELPGDDERENRYSRAARHLREWLHEGVLTQDSARSLYVYHQDFEVEGRPGQPQGRPLSPKAASGSADLGEVGPRRRITRRGFLARVRLEPLGKGRIYAHEDTLPGPRADRLKLFHATQMNLSPIFGLYPDAEEAVQGLLDRAVGRSLPLEATDHLGVVSRLWPVSDQHVLSQVHALMSPRPVFLADGHHRYETGLRYLEERRAAGEVPNDEAAPHFILMMLVSMSDPGLAILPTHRLVSGVPGLTADRLRAVLATHFEVEAAGSGEAGAQTAWEMIQADGGQDLLGFGTTTDGAWQLARFRAPDVAARLAPEHSPEWRGLGVSILHVVFLDHLLPAALSARPSPSAPPSPCRYVHLLREVIQAQASRQCDLAILVPPASMSHVERIAGNLEKMPPKSTYFYPKLLSGLVFNSLRAP